LLPSDVWATVCQTVRPMLLDRCLYAWLAVKVVYCGQTVGWIRMPLGMEVGLGLSHIVFDGDPAPLKGAQQTPHTHTLFSLCLL